ENDRRRATGQPQLQPVIVSVVHVGLRKQRSRGEFVIDGYEGSKATAERQVGHSRLRRNPGRLPAYIFDTLSLYALPEGNEPELKCEDKRDNVRTNRKAQQASTRSTAIVSPSKQ